MRPIRLAILRTLNDRRVTSELSKVDRRAWEIRVVGDEVAGEDMTASLPPLRHLLKQVGHRV